VVPRDQEYWQRLRKDPRSNWAAGLAAIATLAATVSLVALLVQGTHYQARGNPLYWALMLPAAWWVSGLTGFEAKYVRLWKPILLLAVVIAGAVPFAGVGRSDWSFMVGAFVVTLVTAATSLFLLRGSMVAVEGPAR